MAKGDIHLTILRPRVSRNGRRYTKENIGKAVARMQERLGGGGLPVTMNVSHGATIDGDVTKTAAYIKSVWQAEDGSAKAVARLTDTQAGRDVGALLQPDEDGQAGLRGVSIFGRWLGKVRKEDGAETADDLEVTGIDFTHYPGVEGAQVDAIESVPAEMAAAGIFGEAFEEDVFMDRTDEQVRVREDGLPVTPVAEAKDPKKPYGSVKYADPGYQKDGVARYPLDSKEHCRAAWSYVNMPKNARKYTAAQLARVKSRIKAACKKFGIDVAKEAEDLAGEIAESLGDVLEAWASMNISNGSGSITASGYTSDSKEIKALAQRIALAALAGMDTLDPDHDDDVDTDAGESCPDCLEPLAEANASCPAGGHPVSEAHAPSPRKQEVGGMPEFSRDQVAALLTTEQAAALDPAKESYTDAEVKALVAVATPATPATEAAPKGKLTKEQKAALEAVGIDPKALKGAKPKGKLTPEQKVERAKERLAEAERKAGSKMTTEDIVKAATEAAVAAVKGTLAESAQAGFRAAPQRKGLVPMLEEMEAATPAPEKLAEMSDEELWADFASSSIPLA